MRSTKQYLYLGLGMLALGGLMSTQAAAQIQSNTTTVSLTATLAESLTISSTPSAVTFALTPGGTVAGNTAVAVTTTWNTSTVEGNLELDGYFSSATTALSNSTYIIPPSAVLGQVLTGSPTTFTAFTGNSGASTNPVGTAGATLPLFNLALTSANRAGTRTDNLNLKINLSGSTALQQLPAAVYTGTLNLRAQAY